MVVHLLQWDKAHPDQVLLDLLCLPYLLSCLSFQWGPIEYKIIRWVHTISSFFFFFIAATLSFCNFYSKLSWRFLRSLGFFWAHILLIYLRIMEPLRVGGVLRVCCIPPCRTWLAKPDMTIYSERFPGHPSTEWKKSQRRDSNPGLLVQSRVCYLFDKGDWLNNIRRDADLRIIILTGSPLIPLSPLGPSCPGMPSVPWKTGDFTLAGKRSFL